MLIKKPREKKKNEEIFRKESALPEVFHGCNYTLCLHPNSIPANSFSVLLLIFLLCLPSLMCTRLYFLLVSRFLLFCLCIKIFSLLFTSNETSSGCYEKLFNPWRIWNQLEYENYWNLIDFGPDFCLHPVIELHPASSDIFHPQSSKINRTWSHFMSKIKHNPQIYIQNIKNNKF